MSTLVETRHNTIGTIVVAIILALVLDWQETSHGQVGKPLSANCNEVQEGVHANVHAVAICLVVANREIITARAVAAPIDKLFVKGVLLLLGHKSNSQKILISMGMIIFDLPDAATLDEVSFLPVEARWHQCQFFKEGLDRDTNRVFVKRELVLALLDSTILGDRCLDKKERMMHVYHTLLRPLDVFVRRIKH
jgi:hypothetical protein